MFAQPPSAPVFAPNLWSPEDPEDLEPGVAHTARWTAAMRAIESERPDALFRDPLAGILAGQSSVRGWKAEMQACMASQPQSRSHIAIRCRALDDLIMQEIEDMAPASTVQVVSLGAGMCTRPWRLLLPEAIWFEVDLPDIIRMKSRIIRDQRAIATVKEHIAIGVDFSDDTVSLSQTLEAHGYDACLPTVFIMEGLLYFLHLKDLQEIALEMHELMGAEQSHGLARIILTCINEGFLAQLLGPTHLADKRRMEELSNPRRFPGVAQTEGDPLFKSCWEPGCKEIFEDAGWCVVSKISREEYGLKKLQVPMLLFGFPDPKTATEYFIVMHRKPQGIRALLNMIPWYCGHTPEAWKD